MKERIIKEIESRGYTAKEVTVQKNGVEKKGICITGIIDNIAPTIYEDSFNEVEDPAAYIDAVVHHLPRDAKVNTFVQHLKDKEWVKTHVKPRLQRKGSDAIIKRDYLDLEEYVAIEYGEMSIRLRPDHLEMIGLTESELFEAAERNAAEESVIISMNDMLASLIPGSDGADDDLPMWIVTNKSKAFGARALLYKEVFDRFCNKHDCKQIFIIPSSVHELLIFGGGAEIPDINTIISSVNANEVNPEERLSDHVYVYDRNEEAIMLPVA